MYPVLVGVGNVPYVESYVTVFVALLEPLATDQPDVVGMVPPFALAVTV